MVQRMWGCQKHPYSEKCTLQTASVWQSGEPSLPLRLRFHVLLLLNMASAAVGGTNQPALVVNGNGKSLVCKCFAYEANEHSKPEDRSMCKQ